MYLAQLEEARKAGKKIKRLGWPKGSYMVAPKTQIILELDPSEAKEVGVKETAEIVVSPGVNVLVINENKAYLGYELTHEDKTSQDWEEA